MKALTDLFGIAAGVFLIYLASTTDGATSLAGSMLGGGLVGYCFTGLIMGDRYR